MPLNSLPLSMTNGSKRQPVPSKHVRNGKRAHDGAPVYGCEALTLEPWSSSRPQRPACLGGRACVCGGTHAPKVKHTLGAGGPSGGPRSRACRPRAC